MGGGIGHLVMSGPLILAIPVAAAAGAITFVSPCCLPLVPGYLAYLTGMPGADAASAAPGRPVSRGRAVAGTALFVLGFSVLFAGYSAAFGGAGEQLLAHQRVLTQVLGAVTIVLGPLFAGRLTGFPSPGGCCARRCGPEPGWPGRRCSGCCSGWAGRRAPARRWPCSRWRRPPGRRPRRPARVRARLASASGSSPPRRRSSAA
jgi:cytochrome c-type biogenesis protein